MIIFKQPQKLSLYLDSLTKQHPIIGFVPTMGALHEGHISLLEQSNKESGLTVCSIFVNPTQFNDPKDYEKYPVSIEEDIYKIESAGTDILFLPDARAVYPDGTENLEQYRLGYLETVLEGKFRPGHFQGVCQVMSRLLKMVRPAKLFLGQKDYQQSLVIQQLLKTMNADTDLVVCPTVREAHGLAMSSRNRRLTDTERKIAGNIFKTLTYIKENLIAGELHSLKIEAKALLTQNGFTVDYVEIADAGNLSLADAWDGKQELVALAAVFSREIRLIDNMRISGQ
ncbi:MAG: pantoate--beta-alanine ligase [Chitinophagaceae bacterium]|nr:pantoate--beta-alanine ligase [Chitinophagaceae bacterium]